MTFSIITTLAAHRYNVPPKARTAATCFDITIALGALTTGALALAGIPHINAMSTDAVWGLIGTGTFQVILLAIKHGRYIRKQQRYIKELEERPLCSDAWHAEIETELSAAREHRNQAEDRARGAEGELDAVRSDGAMAVELRKAHAHAEAHTAHLLREYQARTVVQVRETVDAVNHDAEGRIAAAEAVVRGLAAENESLRIELARYKPETTS